MVNAFSPGLLLNPSKSVGLNCSLLSFSQMVKNWRESTLLNQLAITALGSSSFLKRAMSVKLIKSSSPIPVISISMFFMVIFFHKTLLLYIGKYYVFSRGHFFENLRKFFY